MVRYNVNITTNSPRRIETLVTNAITSYNDINLNDFNVSYRNSAFCREIDFADVSVISNITDVRMYKKMNIRLGEISNYTVSFDIPIRDTLPAIGSSYIKNREHALISDPFVYNGQTVKMQDNGAGIMRLFKTSNDSDVEVAKIGSVDYKNGLVYINNLNMQSYSGPSFRLYAYPKDKDVKSNKNTIMLIEPSGINISVEEIRTD